MNKPYLQSAACDPCIRPEPTDSTQKQESGNHHVENGCEGVYQEQSEIFPDCESASFCQGEDSNG